MLRIFLALLFLSLASVATAQDCRNISYEGNRFTVCEVDASQADIRLFLKGDDGEILGRFSNVDKMLQAEGRQLAFAMNGGMYHRNRAPVGYYVENGTEVMHVVPNAGPGNFGMLPNGVFCVRPGRADVIETLEFVKRTPECTFATQSGPMLVIDGALHPRFLADSTSRFERNGVGTSADGKRAVFVISGNAVTFYEFGNLFLDRLGLPNALYLDGKVSKLYAPGLGRNDAGFSMGPIVGVVVDRPE